MPEDVYACLLGAGIDQKITGNSDFSLKFSWDFGISQIWTGVVENHLIGIWLKINWDLGLGTPLPHKNPHARAVDGGACRQLNQAPRWA